MENFTLILLSFVLVIMGGILFYKIRYSHEKLLKTAIILPLVYLITELLMFIPDWGSLIYIVLFIALPFSLLGVILSIISFIKRSSEVNKIFYISAFIYSILTVILSLKFYSGLTM